MNNFAYPALRRFPSFTRLPFTMVLLCITCLMPNFSYAQGASSAGTDFWVGFMPNFIGGRNVTQLFIASGTSNTVKVTYAGSTRTYVIGPNTATQVDLGGLGVTRVSEKASEEAIHVTSSAPLTLYGYNVWDGGAGFLGGSPDGFLALPTSSLGSKYYTVNYYDSWFAGQKTSGQFLVIATQDFTDVTITTKAHTRGPDGAESHIPGDKWTVSLMKGQTYMVQSTGEYLADDDLTGSLVESNKPVALLSGHQITPITVEMSSADYLIEMVPPLDKWGTEYFNMPMLGRTVCGDYLRILSGEDGNQITYNGNGPFLLNAGEYAEIVTSTVPEVLKSINNKKFIVAQYSYSQGYNGDPGTADPFMILMTPQEQFQKKMIFCTPRAADNGTFNNYLTIIGEKDSLYTVKINGKSLSSFGSVGEVSFTGTSNPVMGGIRVPLGSGSKTYTATANFPFGMYQYGFSFYEGYGWPTGMALNIVSPDTLAPLEARTENCGNFNVRVREPRLMPKFSFNDTRLADIGMITEPNDPRWNKPSFNYEFILDPAFRPDDSVTDFALNVIDPSKDAYAAIFAMDRAGNDTVFEYTYTAPKLTLSSASPYNFGAVLVGSDSCKIITVTNASTNDIRLSNLHLLNLSPGSFSVAPANMDKMLKPGETADITICYNARDTGSARAALDSLALTTGCVTLRYALNGQGVTPLILASDLNFGTVDSGKSICKNLQISNPGSYPLTITKQNLLNTADFSVDPSQAFPVIIAPGASAIIRYCFHPTRTGTFRTTALFTTLNPVGFEHSIKDTSVLTGQSLARGALLTNYEYKIVATCDTKPIMIDTVYNPLAADAQIDSATISGPDAASFSILGFKPGNGLYPYVLGKSPATGVEYQIQFDPTVKGMTAGKRMADFTVYGHDGIKLSAAIEAESKVPVLTVVDPAPLNLGVTGIGLQLTGTFTIKNTGSDNLNVGTITAAGDGGFFSVTPQAPFTLVPGQSQDETVTFIPGGQARVYSVEYTFSPGGNLCATSQKKQVIAEATSTGFRVLGADYGAVFTCKSRDLQGSFTNSSSADAVTLTSVTVENTGAWTNAADFIQTPPLTLPITVNAGLTQDVAVRFIPSARGPRNAGLVFVYKTTTGSYDTLVAPLTGIGDNLTSIVGAGSTSAISTYAAPAGHVIDVPIVLDRSFEGTTNEVYGYSFDVSWIRDAFKFSDVSAPSATITQNGASTFDPATGIETYHFKAMGTAPLGNEKTLAHLGMTVMLDTSAASTIVPTAVQFLDKNGAALCYIASTTVDGAFEFMAACGDKTIANNLRGNKTQLSISLPSPNPFRTSTSVNFNVRINNSAVTMAVYDALGNEVASLIDNKTESAGKHSATFDAKGLASGTYYIRLTDGTFTTTRSVVLQR